jgi:hypothetical protein
MAKKSRKPKPAHTALMEPSRLYAHSYATRLAKQVDQEIGNRRGQAAPPRAKKRARA